MANILGPGDSGSYILKLKRTLRVDLSDFVLRSHCQNLLEDPRISENCLLLYIADRSSVVWPPVGQYMVSGFDL